MTAMTFNGSSWNVSPLNVFVFNGDPSSCIGVPPVFTSTPLTTITTHIDPNALAESARRITRKPDHEFTPFDDLDGHPNAKRVKRVCQRCTPGSIWMDDPGAHLYVIREWGIG